MGRTGPFKKKQKPELMALSNLPVGDLQDTFFLCALVCMQAYRVCLSVSLNGPVCLCLFFKSIYQVCQSLTWSPQLSNLFIILLICKSHIQRKERQLKLLYKQLGNLPGFPHPALGKLSFVISLGYCISLQCIETDHMARLRMPWTQSKFSAAAAPQQLQGVVSDKKWGGGESLQMDLECLHEGKQGCHLGAGKYLKILGGGAWRIWDSGGGDFSTV